MQAKTYVARHEGALQERFAMSRSTRDLWARFKILMAAVSDTYFHFSFIKTVTIQCLLESKQEKKTKKSSETFRNQKLNHKLFQTLLLLFKLNLTFHLKLKQLYEFFMHHTNC